MTEDELIPDDHLSLEVKDTQKIPTSRKRGGFLSLLLLFAVAGLSGLGYQQWHKLQTEFQQLNHTLTPLANQQVTLVKQIQTLRQQFELEQTQLEAAQTHISQLNELVTNNQGGWMLIEATHLLQLANLSLQYDNNVSATLTLLQLADQRLAVVADPHLTPLRQAIADDITRLQAIPNLDVTGLYLRLEALREQNLTLPLVQQRYQSNEVNNLLTPHIATGILSTWQKAGNTMSDALSKVLVIRYREVPLAPLLTGGQEQLLLQTLSTLYSQAQWALLHQQAGIYQSSLEQISKLVADYFQFNNQSQSIITNINELKKINIAPVLPDLAPTLAALQQYQKQANQK